MNLLLDQMEKKFPGLNTKPYSFADVETLCKRQHINLKIAAYEENMRGYYCIRRTAKRVKRFIVLNSQLGPVEKVFTGLHELSHHFLHVPVSVREYYCCKRLADAKDKKQECEADALALMLMIPLWMLIDHEAVNFENIQPELLPYLIRRKRLWEKYAI